MVCDKVVCGQSCVWTKLCVCATELCVKEGGGGGGGSIKNKNPRHKDAGENKNISSPGLVFGRGLLGHGFVAVKWC